MTSAQVELRALHSEAELAEQAHQADMRKQEQLAAAGLSRRGPS